MIARTFLGVALVIAVSGCAGDEPMETTAGVALGDPTDPTMWSQYCVATFTQDVTTDHGFTFTEGSKHLYSEDSLGHKMIVLTDTAAFSIEVPDLAPLPFTANCVPDEGTPYLAILMDSVLYEDKELTKVGCELSAGTVVPARGFYSVFNAGRVDDDPDYRIYEHTIEELSELCGGAESYFVAHKDVELTGLLTTPAPIRLIYGPA